VGGLMLVILLLEIFRYRLIPWNKIYTRLFELLLTEKEKGYIFTGAISLWFSIYFIYLFFSKTIFLISSLIVVLADPMAAMVGKFAKSKKLFQEKTTSGSLTFLLITLLIIWQYSNIPLIFSIFLAIILCLVELLSPAIWENIFIITGSALLLFVFDKLSLGR
jgi:dolichol kinase